MLEEKLDIYLNNRIKYYKRLKYSWFTEVIKYDWNDEFFILSFSEYSLKDDFHGALHYFKHINYYWLVLAALCMLINIFFASSALNATKLFFI